jgi:hypothetical protein
VEHWCRGLEPAPNTSLNALLKRRSRKSHRNSLQSLSPHIDLVQKTSKLAFGQETLRVHDFQETLLSTEHYCGCSQRLHRAYRFEAEDSHRTKMLLAAL